MKSITRLKLLLILIPVVLFILSCAEKETEDLLFFYFESCPSCDEYKMAGEYSEIIDSLDKKRVWTASHHNLITPEAAAELKRVLGEKGLPDISRSLPLLIIGDEYINGYESIGEKLDELSS